MKTLLMALLLGSCAFGSDFTRGNQVDATIRDSMSVYEDSDVCARVAEIGQKMVAASGNPSGFSFHFYVLNSPDVTTFSAPGGPVYVTTGLLQHLKSEDELAVVLGHEIAHINERHMMKTETSERSKIFWGRVLIVGAVAGGAFAGAVVQVETAKALTNTVAMVPAGQTQAYTVPTRNFGLISSTTVPSVPQYRLLTADPAGSQLAGLTNRAVAWGTASGGETLLNLYFQGYKNDYEFAADKLAIEYADKAGYDGGALIHVLERLSGSTGEISPNEISHLHSSSKGLEARTVQARGQATTPPKQNP